MANITSSEMYSLHLTHPKWTHTRSSGQPCYSARGAVGGSVSCSRTPQSWYWRRILPPPTIPAGPEIRTHNLPLSYPLGHDCPTYFRNTLCFCVFLFFSSSAAPVPIHFHCMTQSIINFRLNISYLVEKMSNGFGISWGWVNDSSFQSEPFLSLVWERGNSVISKTAHWTHN